MVENRKTKAQLISELNQLRERIAELEEEENSRQRQEKEIQEKIQELTLTHQQTIIYARELAQEIAERKRIETELRKYKDHLEEQVAERTEALSQTNSQLQAEIAERKRFEQALAEERNLLRTLIDNLPDDIYVKDTKGRFIVSNAAHMRRLGAGTTDEVVNKTDFDFFPLELATEYDADEMTIMESGQPVFNREEFFLHPTSKTRWFSTSKVPLRDTYGQITGLVSTSRDITERKWAEAELKKQQKYLEEQVAERTSELTKINEKLRQQASELTSLHAITQAITSSLDLRKTLTLITDHTVKLLDVEAASVSLFDPVRKDLWFAATSGGYFNKILNQRLPLGKGVVGWVTQHGKPALVLDTSQDKRFFDVFDKQSGFNTQSIICVPLKTKGKTIGAIEAINKNHDDFDQDDLNQLTLLAAPAAIAIENARLYEEGREQYRRLQQSQAQLIQVEKMAALGRLVASIAHEINNPLQSVGSCLTLVEEVLEDSQHGQLVNQYLNIAGEEIGRIATIVRRMRDFYRPIRHTGHIWRSDSIEDFYHSIREDLKEVDLHTVLDNVLQLANKQLQHNGVEVGKLWSDNLPLIGGNPDSLKQVFLNLVLNAIDAMADRGGTLGVRTATTQLLSRDGLQQQAVCVEFEDTGVGMSSETLSRVFEPLFTTKDHGSGFGLYTSYKIVEAHGGQITASSNEAKGTTFTILLPVEQL